MSDLAFDDAYDDEAEDAEDFTEEAAEESGDDTDDSRGAELAALAHSYTAASRRQRLAIWAELTEDTRQALSGFGITGPVTTSADDSFEPITPDDPQFLTRMRLADHEARSGLDAMRTGDLDVATELEGEVADLLATADELPDSHPDRARSIQAAAHLTERARAAAIAAGPAFDAGNLEVRRERPLGENRFEITETDRAGRTRVTIVEAPTAAEKAEATRDAFVAANEVTAEEAASWPADVWMKWRRKNPVHAEHLLRSTGDEMSRVAHRQMFAPQ